MVLCQIYIYIKLHSSNIMLYFICLYTFYISFPLGSGVDSILNTLRCAKRHLNLVIHQMRPSNPRSRVIASTIKSQPCSNAPSLKPFPGNGDVPKGDIFLDAKQYAINQCLVF